MSDSKSAAEEPLLGSTVTTAATRTTATATATTATTTATTTTTAENELPIAAYHDQLIEAVRTNDALVILGETGSGKTTQLPQFLLKAGFAKNGPIVVTQPRRVAAISVAERVAEELDVTLGEEVGYQVRFDNTSCDSTKLKYVTDGCLLRECLENPSLSNYSVVILDEAHIRSLDTDVLFGLVKNIIMNTEDENRPKIIVMSATLETEKFSDFFDCNIFLIPGRVFPVTTVYCNLLEPDDKGSINRYVSKAVEVAMQIHVSQPEGDILIFLTGRDEIERACDELYRRSENLDYRYDVDYHKEVNALMVLPVYGSMPTHLQRRIFRPAEKGIRKIVVATDIASTSLTVDGIVYVVDCGFCKQKKYNPHTGLDALQIVPISVSEANQRAGRAGRTKAGFCHRLYSEDFMEKLMIQHTPPEIQRISLTTVALTLKSLHIHDVLGFPYLDKPETLMLLEALRELYFFGAIDKQGKITNVGKAMASFPLQPSLARVLLYAKQQGWEKDVAKVVAMLSVENVFARPSQKHAEEAKEIHEELFHHAGDDFNILLYIFNSCMQSVSARRWCQDHFVLFRPVQTAMKVKDQLMDILYSKQVDNIRLEGVERVGDIDEEGQKGHGKRKRHRAPGVSQAVRTKIRRSLCQGFFHKVARVGSNGRHFRTMDGHASTVSIHPSSSLFGNDDGLNWVLYYEVVWTTKPYMRTITPIEYVWVKSLLPKLHEVNTLELTKVPTDRDDAGASTENADSPDGGETSKSTVVVGRRNNEDAVAKAKARYLARRKARTGTG